MSVDSWTLDPKPLCHRHPTGPHPSGLLWTPWASAKGDSTKSNFALGSPRRLHTSTGVAVRFRSSSDHLRLAHLLDLVGRAAQPLAVDRLAIAAEHRR